MAKVVSRLFQSCGCIVLMDDAPIIINGVDMGGMVSNICGIERCPKHQAQWLEACKPVFDVWDRLIRERILAKLSQIP